MIINHEHPIYRGLWPGCGNDRFNGAYYYSKEICEHIIPRVKTSRNWVTINIRGYADNHAIVFIHNNMDPHLYDWLSEYDDLILVCGIPETCARVSYLGQPIYLPLSVDVAEVEKYKCEKTKDTAYIGRPNKRKHIEFPEGTQYIEGLPREEFLAEVARYRRVYAVGRAAIEAKILGCEILPYDPRFTNPERWKIVDSKQAAIILQLQLDEIDEGR